MKIFLDAIEPLRKTNPRKWVRALRVLYSQLGGSSWLRERHGWLDKLPGLGDFDPDDWAVYRWRTIWMHSASWRVPKYRERALAQYGKGAIAAKALAQFRMRALDPDECFTSFDIVGALAPGMYP